jgi:6-pyruvoyltetrahydropterin 2'-reductase
MSKLKIAEIFYSIQGEGEWAGAPSVFLRTFGCNFECRGFGLPKGQKTDEPEKFAAMVKSGEIKNFKELPLAKYGCDSYASWHPSFKEFSPMMTVDEIVDAMLALTPEGKWSLPTGQDIHLVITGGEPLLGWQRSYIELFQHPKMRDLRHVTFETNATQELKGELRGYLAHAGFWTTFSCSPKLSVSGEKWEEAIRPEVVKTYLGLPQADLYFKFVVATNDDVEEVDSAVEEYNLGGVLAPVYLMPVGGMPELYHLNTKDIALLAMKKGYRYSPRLQVDIFRNEWGT